MHKAQSPCGNQFSFFPRTCDVQLLEPAEMSFTDIRLLRLSGIEQALRRREITPAISEVLASWKCKFRLRLNRLHSHNSRRIAGFVARRNSALQLQSE